MTAMIVTGLMLAAVLFGQDDGPLVTATRAQNCILGGQPVECPPASEHPPVYQPTAEEIAEKARADAQFSEWMAGYAERTAPDWKIDPHGWLTFQCKDVAAAAERVQCEGDARLRLAQLRAEQIDARPVADPPPPPARGGGVSVSTSLLDDEAERSSPRSQGSCDGPASGEGNAAFVARCPPGGGPRRD